MGNVHAAAMHAPEALSRCPIMPTYGPPSVMLTRGEGAWLWDADGNRFLDLLSGLAVTSLGHAHPEVAEAIAAQATTLLHVSNLFGTEHGWHVATTLDRLIGDGTPVGGQVFFSNSGAEANECAIKLARRHGGGEHGRWQVVSALGSFHGRTLATLAATGQPAKWEAFQPLPEGFVHVPWADLDELEAAIGEHTAAVLLEPVQGEGGVNPATPDYLRGVRELCDRHGILMIMDEVQCGLGRTGRWFGFQHAGITPDVVTMAKALGNGMPIGACWARAEVAASFRPGDHATTYGGQPLSTATARAVLEVMLREDVPARAERASRRFAERLTKLDGVVGVRGLGLLLAVELADRPAAEVNAALLRAGALANAVTPTALRLAPSLLITDDEIDHATDLIEAAIAAVPARTEGTSS